MNKPLLPEHKPSLKESGHGGLVGLDVFVGLHLGDDAAAFDLRRALALAAWQRNELGL